MKTAFSLFIFVCVFIAFAESADIGNYTIPFDVTVNGSTIPVGSYAIRVQTDQHPAIELLKGDQVIGSEPAIVLPAAGSDETTITVVKSKKQDYVRIRIRYDSTWYIVYLPAAQQSALSTQHS